MGDFIDLSGLQFCKGSHFVPAPHITPLFIVIITYLSYLSNGPYAHTPPYTAIRGYTAIRRGCSRAKNITILDYEMIYARETQEPQQSYTEEREKERI